MNIIDMVLIIATLVVLAEVSYLVVKLPRQSVGRKQARSILIDTSVLIDGRIIPIARSGFVTDTFVIPRSVIRELQFLADNADHDKRARARYGLDVVQQLQALDTITVEILADGTRATEGVDERLLTLAKKYNAAVCTIDYNLNKVAVVEGITVLNVNELAQSLRMAYLPGERMIIELVQKGQDAHQGVGYLPDGTMVVVEHANKYVGQSVEIEFIRSLQTAAGKMMFARRIEQQVKPAQKPTGKKPVVATPAKQQPQSAKHKAAEITTPKAAETVKKPQQTQKPSQRPSKAASASNQPTVYHSDTREAKKANVSTQSTPAQSVKTTANDTSAVDDTKETTGTSKRRRSRRKNSSEAREASFIDLVNKQDE